MESDPLDQAGKTAAAPSVTPDAAASSSSEEKSQSAGNVFECSICLELPNDPVVSFCGHLFCWPCLHEWLAVRARGEQSASCPVCKAAVDRDKVVPLYGRNSKQEDPRNKTVPPRPQGRRTQPEPHPNMGGEFVPFPGFGVGNAGFHMTFGFGLLPLNLLLTALNIGVNANGAQQNPQGIVSKLLIGLAILFLFAIIFL